MRSSSILSSLLLSFLPRGPNDRLFFWASGHGAYLYIAKDHNTDLVLLPGAQITYCGHDERDIKDEILAVASTSSLHSLSPSSTAITTLPSGTQTSWYVLRLTLLCSHTVSIGSAWSVDGTTLTDVDEHPNGRGLHSVGIQSEIGHQLDLSTRYLTRHWWQLCSRGWILQ